MGVRETSLRRGAREGVAPVWKESLGGEQNPRKEQAYRVLQHTSGTNWTRRWSKPLKSAAAAAEAARRWCRSGGHGSDVRSIRRGPENHRRTSAPRRRTADSRGSGEPENGPRRSTRPRDIAGRGTLRSPGLPRGRQKEPESPATNEGRGESRGTGAARPTGRRLPAAVWSEEQGSTADTPRSRDRGRTGNRPHRP